MRNKAVMRVLLVFLVVALVGQACASRPGEITPTVSPVEPTVVSSPTPTPTPVPAEPPTPFPARVSISPVSGPPGNEVLAVVTGFAAETQVGLGLGRLNSEYHIVSRPRMPSEGALTTRLVIPVSAEPGQQWVVVAEMEDGAARAVSNAFEVTAIPTPAVETPTPSEELLLPDLLVIPPQTVYIEHQGGRRYLRFDTSFANVGQAALHLIGERDPESELVRAIQEVTTADGEERSEEIGAFVFHPGHTHWHLEEFAQYELWRYPEAGERELMASKEKVSFCMFDYRAYDLTLPNAAQVRQFQSCDEEVQGLSVGWADTYLPDLDGQAFDITDFPDGRYQLKMIANPTNHIMESNFDNNEAAAIIEISGSTVQIVEE